MDCPGAAAAAVAQGLSSNAARSSGVARVAAVGAARFDVDVDVDVAVEYYLVVARRTHPS